MTSTLLEPGAGSVIGSAGREERRYPVLIILLVISVSTTL